MKHPYVGVRKKARAIQFRLIVELHNDDFDLDRTRVFGYFATLSNGSMDFTPSFDFTSQKQ